MALGPSHDRQDVLQRGMQAERGCRRDTEHEPQAVSSEKANAVNVVGQPVGILADQPGRIVAVCLAYAACISFPRPMWRRHESTFAMVAT